LSSLFLTLIATGNFLGITSETLTSCSGRTMKRNPLLLIVAVLCSLVAFNQSVSGQGTAFTYQGRLNDGASLANGSYDLTFTLFDTNGGGSTVAGPLTFPGTGVTNGLFTLTLDFGNEFPGAGRWLEIGVRTNGVGAFVALSPRQPLTSTPYAVRSANAAIAASANSVAATNITGAVAEAQLSTNVALRNGGNTFTGDQIINGNVGIGTASPPTRLTVVTPDNSYGIEHTDGTRRLSSFLGNGAWFGTVSPDPFYLFANDGAPALTIGTNGNVSIGTPFPGASPLQINAPFLPPLAAGLQVNNAINGVDVQINRGANQGGVGLLLDNSGAGDASTSLLLLRNNAGSSPQTVLDVRADGKVGIQSSTPGKTLQVGDPAVVGSEGMIRLSSRTATGGAATRTWDIGVPQTGDTASGIGYSFVINDAALGTSTPQLLLQWGTGNVGIGTTNPGAKLDVNGTVNAAGFSGGGAALTGLSSAQLTSIGNTNTGYENFFVGPSGNATTSGFDNTANGFEALFSNTSGSVNTASGSYALYHNTSGFENTASGVNALYNNTNGVGNTANGYEALVGNMSGNHNTADGFQTLFNNTSGSGNIALGYNAGLNITTGSSNIDIGNQGLAADTNIIRIGSGQAQTFIAGNVGIGVGTTSPGQLLQVGGPTTTTDGMIRLSCGNGPFSHAWDIGVPYGNNVTNSPYYGFVINDASAGVTRFAIDFNTGDVQVNGAVQANSVQVNGAVTATDAVQANSVQANTVQVAGDVVATEVLVADAHYYSSVADTPLRIVRGGINPDGSRFTGAGYSVTHTNLGTYIITFTTPFTDYPAVTVTASSSGAVASTGSLITNSAAVNIVDALGIPADSGFYFIAIGGRPSVF
jgi:hypothetical protein